MKKIFFCALVLMSAATFANPIENDNSAPNDCVFAVGDIANGHDVDNRLTPNKIKIIQTAKELGCSYTEDRQKATMLINFGSKYLHTRNNMDWDECTKNLFRVTVAIHDKSSQILLARESEKSRYSDCHSDDRRFRKNTDQALVRAIKESVEKKRILDETLKDI